MYFVGATDKFLVPSSGLQPLSPSLRGANKISGTVCLGNNVICYDLALAFEIDPANERTET